MKVLFSRTEELINMFSKNIYKILTSNRYNNIVFESNSNSSSISREPDPLNSNKNI